MGKLCNRLNEIEKYILRHRLYFLEQEKEDLSQEIQRCVDAVKYLQTNIAVQRGYASRYIITFQCYLFF